MELITNLSKDGGLFRAWRDQGPFAMWMLDAIGPALLVYAAVDMGMDASYLVWCQAVRRLALSTRCHVVVRNLASMVPSGQIDNHPDFASFSQFVEEAPERAPESFLDRTVDLLVLREPAESDALIFMQTFDAWLPKLSNRGVVLLQWRQDGQDSKLVCDVLRERYRALAMPEGQCDLLAVGPSTPPLIRELLEMPDVGKAPILPGNESILVSGDAPGGSMANSELAGLRRMLVENGERLRKMEEAQALQELKVRSLTRALNGANFSAQTTLQNLHAAQREIAVLVGSRSWAITAPLRRLLDILRRCKRRLARLTQLAATARRLTATEGWTSVVRRTVVFLSRRSGLLAAFGNDGGAAALAYSLQQPRPASERLAQRVLLVAELGLPQCLKYRVLQKQQMIESLGVDCTVVDWGDIASTRSYLQTHTMAIFYRVPGYPAQLEIIRLAKSLGIATFWEVDDLIFDLELYKKNSNIDDLSQELRESILYGVPLYREAMLACDACIASTEALADVMRSAGVKEVFVVENALDEETMRLAEEINAQSLRKDGLIRVVYGSGSLAHDSDFRVAGPAIKRLLESRYDVRLTIIGTVSLPSYFDGLEAQIEKLPASDYATYLQRLAKCDINIAPLEDSVFNDAKSNIKYLEAAMLKVPSVCSPTMEYRFAIRQGETGFLAETQEQWEAMLLSLVEDAALRAKVGESAYRHVMENYTPEILASKRVAPLLKSYDGFSPKKPRVLGVNIFFEPRSFGGATIVAEEVARLINAGIQLEYGVLTSLPTSDVLPPYRVVRYESSAGEVFGIGLPFEADPALDFDNPHSVGAFREVLRAWRPDVVHLHSIQGFGVQIAETCRSAGIPFVVTLHDAWWICARQFMVTREGRYCHQRTIDLGVCAKCVDRPALNPYRQFLLHEVLSSAAMLLSPSEFFRRLYIDNGFDPDKVVVNKNGIVPPKRAIVRSQPSQRPLRFGFVGGEGPIKGGELIKKVFRDLPHMNYELHVVDNALNLGRSSVYEANWQIPGEIKIVPAYTQESIDDFFGNIDVLLFPTQWKESFGLSVREALIRDVWVIATDAGGVVEDIVDGENGDIVSFDDGGLQFQAAIKRLLDDPGRLDGYRNMHANMIRIFEEQAQELTSLLAGIIKNSPRQRLKLAKAGFPRNYP